MAEVPKSRSEQGPSIIKVEKCHKIHNSGAIDTSEVCGQGEREIVEETK
jgi:hypothetical protein